jgi:hypothetical protein
VTVAAGVHKGGEMIGGVVDSTKLETPCEDVEVAAGPRRAALLRVCGAL